MEKVYKFKAELIKADKVDGAYVKFPFNVKDEFGTNGRVKVCASFDGEKYRGILAKMGEDCHIIGVTKAIRKKIQKETGDEIEVIIKEDNKSRQEEVPEIFESALNKNKLAKEFFDTLTGSQKISL